MYVTIKQKAFLGLLFVLASLLVMSSIVTQRFVGDVVEKEITYSIDHAVLAYKRYEQQRDNLMLTQARSVAQAAYLRATLSIPDVDSQTVYFAGNDLKEIVNPDLFLVVDSGGYLLADFHEMGHERLNLGLRPGIDEAIFGRESVTFWDYRGRFYRVAVVPAITAEQVVGLIVIGERLDTSSAVAALEEVTGVRGAIVFDGLVHTTNPLAATKDILHITRLFDTARSLLLQKTPGQKPEAVTTGDFAVQGETYVASLIRHDPARGMTLLWRGYGQFSSSVDTLIMPLITIGVFVVVFGIALSLWVSSRISRPLGQLTNAARQYGKGNLKHRVIAESRDEIGTLAIAFNRMADDIVERRKAFEKATEERKIAESSDLAKSEFLANMSHEIRTPLNGILGMTSVLLNADMSPDLKEKVEVVWESSAVLHRLVNDILDLSKLDAGKIDIEDIDFDIAGLINGQYLLWHERYEEKGLKLKVDLNPDIPPTLIGDPLRIRQVLSNLINNALKFTQTGGTSICVDVVCESEDDVELKIAVKDTGIGIKEDAIGALFSRFTQADTSTTRKFGGTGLGLSICKDLVVAMGGDINVTSVFGEGTAIWFTLKLGYAKKSAATNVDRLPSARDEVHQARVERARPARILVAEDNPMNRQVITAMLSAAKVEFDIVEDGAKAVAAVQESPYDIVLMDIQMPVMDGPEALQKIRILPGEVCEIPVIALTANAMSGDRETFLKQGFSGYVSKPIRFADLVQAIDKFAKHEEAGQDLASQTNASSVKLASSAKLEGPITNQPLEFPKRLKA